MAHEPPQQAEAALADLAEQFDHWRQTRTTAQERIPPALWDQAVALTVVLPCAQVARRAPSPFDRFEAARPGGADVGGDRSHRAEPGLCRSTRALAGIGGVRRRPDRD